MYVVDCHISVLKGAHAEVSTAMKEKNDRNSQGSLWLSSCINVVWQRWKIPASDLKMLVTALHYQSQRTGPVFCILSAADGLIP